MSVSLAARRALGSALVFFALASVGQTRPADDFVGQRSQPALAAGQGPGLRATPPTERYVKISTHPIRQCRSKVKEDSEYVLRRSTTGLIVGLDKPAGELFDRSSHEFAIHRHGLSLCRRGSTRGALDCGGSAGRDGALGQGILLEAFD